MLITIDEMIKQLKAAGISLGRNPKRTLIYWREKGLLPVPTLIRKGGKSGTISFYEQSNIDRIKHIRELQGIMNLDVIRYFVKDEAVDSQLAETDDLKTRQDYLRHALDELLSLQDKAISNGCCTKEEILKELYMLSVIIVQCCASTKKRYERTPTADTPKTEVVRDIK